MKGGSVYNRFGYRRYPKDRNAGLTLLEILISTSILILLAIAALVSFTQSRRIRDLNTAGQNILSIVRLAQSKTLAGENDSQWGIKIESNQITLFQGTTFTGSPLTEPTQLPATIEIVNISLGGGDEIVFKRIEGTTDQAGTFDIRVKADTSLVFPVTIDASGKAYRSGSVAAPVGTRSIDTRHREFDLGWSIESAATTTLTFENPPYPDTVYEIDMDDFFDAGRTVFDWSGSVGVNLSQETLRIHTVSISPTNTILHIDRDCRTNTKRLTVEIDGKEIGTYEANCKTLTVGAFGGTVTEP